MGAARRLGPRSAPGRAATPAGTNGSEFRKCGAGDVFLAVAGGGNNFADREIECGEIKRMLFHRWSDDSASCLLFVPQPEAGKYDTRGGAIARAGRLFLLARKCHKSDLCKYQKNG